MGPLPDAMVSVAMRPGGGGAGSVQDSVACALACMKLSTASPGYFKGILQAGLVESLATLYKRSGG